MTTAKWIAVGVGALLVLWFLHQGRKLARRVEQPAGRLPAVTPELSTYGGVKPLRPVDVTMPATSSLLALSSLAPIKPTK